MIEYSIAFALGVVSSETVRRLWKAYVSPKLAALRVKIAASIARGG